MEPYDYYTQEPQAPAKRSLWPILVAVVLTAAMTFLITFLALTFRLDKQEEAPTPSQQTVVKPNQPNSEKPAYEKKLEEIRDYVDYYFIGDVEENKLSDAMAAGLIEGLGDEWSYYISADDYDAYLESVQNAYVGIGVTITSEGVEKGLLIKEVTPNSPALEAGLQTGDVIVAVEGTRVLDGSQDCLDLNGTKNLVRGEEGTDVTLTILRDGTERDYTITRRTIHVVNVTYELLEQDLAYIKISNFEENAAQDTLEAINQALQAGAKGIIFDVRYNPGGYKRELLEVLDFLLPEGPLFRSVDYSGRENVDYSDENHLDIPMAVLVNYNSYSAAEFFAAALQEYEAAAVIGEQTYGKGRFQTTFPLSDGSAINISIGQYTTPNGVSLVGQGITPDYPVDLTEEQLQDLYYGRLEHAQDAQLQKAIEVLTK